jgi:hypothetical protein
MHVAEKRKLYWKLVALFHRKKYWNCVKKILAFHARVCQSALFEGMQILLFVLLFHFKLAMNIII